MIEAVAGTCCVVCLGLVILVCFYFGVTGPFTIMRLRNQAEKEAREHLESKRQGSPHIERGRIVLPVAEAAAIAERLKPPNDPGFFFGGIRLPSNNPGEHFAVIGAPGSGKTLTIRCLMNGVLRNVGKGLGHRALIYDAKGDSVSLLAGLGLYAEDATNQVVILNPFDRRSAAWDMARDITDKKTALEIAKILIPTDSHATQPFFTQAASHLLSGVFQALHHAAPGKWSFREVLLILDDEQRLRSVLSNSPNTLGLIAKYIDVREWPSVNATIASKVAELEPVAAAWDRASQKISLQEWVNGEGVLVLGTDRSAESSLAAVNRVILKRLSQLLLSVPESSTRRTWIYIDEAQEAGQLDGLSSLLELGRGYGISVVLGFQDISGWRAVYGADRGDALLSQFQNKAILRVETFPTAKWASEQVDTFERVRQKEGYTYGGTTSQTLTEERAVETAILPSEFMQFRTPDFENGIGIEGLYFIRKIGLFASHIEPSLILENLPPENKSVRNYIERPTDEQQFRPWDEQDVARLLSSPIPHATPHSQPISDQPIEASIIPEGETNAGSEPTQALNSKTDHRQLNDVTRVRFTDES